MKSFSKVACLAGIIVGAAAAHADELRARVNFSDLNVTRIEGAAALYGRIHSAAKIVCAPLDGRSLRESQQFRSCMTTAIERAVSDAHQPKLTEYYESTLGGREHGSSVVASR